VFGKSAGEEEGGEQKQEASAIKEDEALQGGLNQRGYTAGQEQDEGIADDGNGLHEDCFQQGDEMAQGVRQGEEIGNIPHKEEHAQGTHNLLAEDALQAEAGCVVLRPEQEGEGALQVEKEDDGDDQASGGEVAVH